MSRNYTEEQTKEIIDMYQSNPTLDTVTEIAVKFRKTRKSIIAKLSKEGVYQKKVYVSKTGELPVTKAELVDSIKDVLGIDLPQLDKAPKPTLKALKESVAQLQADFDKLLEEYEDGQIKAQMAEAKGRRHVS